MQKFIWVGRLILSIGIDELDFLHMTTYRPDEVSKVPLTETEERELFRAYREDNDLAARDRLIGNFILFARKEAIRAAGGRIPEADISSAAHDGLLDAMRTFNYKKPTARFSTYSIKRLRGSVQTVIRKAIRQSELKARYTEGVVLETTVEPDHEETEIAGLRLAALAEGIKTLNAREKQVITAWLEEKTFTEIGALLGVTRQRAEQLYQVARKKLDPFVKGALAE